MNALTINGRVETVSDDPDALLVDVLRDDLKLTGTKLVCGSGVCGACTVLLDGVPVVSCLMPVNAAVGKSVVTVEGIGARKLHPVQKAFMALDALQCGFCTPGFIVEAAAFHDKWRHTQANATPARDEIAAALSGHLCRCGAYDNILRAVAQACTGDFDGDAIASPRIEAREKVTGAAKYTADIDCEGRLEGLILRSRSAHARIDHLDLKPALAIPGVAAAVSLLGDDRIISFVGEPIAAVAAKDRKTAQEALAAIRIVSESLPAVVGFDAERKPDARIVFAGSHKTPGNVSEGADVPAAWQMKMRRRAAARGAKEVAGAIQTARDAQDPLLVETIFRTATQSHTCLEPHATVAHFDGDQLTVHASTQAVFELKDRIAKRFKLKTENVRIIAEHVGGGFGSKSTVGMETIAAVALSREASAPVRVVYDRHEELTVTGYRPASQIAIALLPSQDGKLKALSMAAYADTGTSVNSTVAMLARFIYPSRLKHLVDHDVISHLPPGAPFRAPGGPQMAFALEQAVDEAALRLNVDPIALRKRWDPDPNRQRLYDWAASLDLWRNASKTPKTGRYRRGVGVATGSWLYIWQPGSKVQLGIKSGRIVASTAVQDMGQGIRTVIANTVAREFGLDPAEIEVRIGDSRLPEGPGSGGSRTTASIVPSILLAVKKLKAAIEQKTRHTPVTSSNVLWRELIAASSDMRVSAERPEDSTQTAPGVRSPLRGVMGSVFGWMLRHASHRVIGAGVPSSVQMVEVEVDTWLGHVRVLDVRVGIAVGRIIAPVLARSQVAGAVIQGIGYALYEGREIDDKTGDILTTNLEEYRIPGISDTPMIEVHFDEGGFEHVPGGGIGLGEVGTVPTSAAIANAIRHAIGVRPQQAPIRPDRLVAMLRTAA
ncbi:molybdopterin-dependent oxidoreductase [Lysobacter sp. CA199]|uniref:molybdopterin-dependent oxidoreductase n=1 Tax=Lysobacter sp. CA199 TaxID=3455608 RepID=UPI003F8D0198